MSSGERVYQTLTGVFAAIIFVFGLVILVRAVGEGAGPASVGILLGVLFTVLGAARFALVIRSRR